MFSEVVSKNEKPDIRSLNKELSGYTKSSLKKSLWQLLNTIIPYFVLWGVMAFLVVQGYSYWIPFGLSVITGLLLVRIFIFFHDCCHGSFFKSKRANTIVGYITGIITFTPFDEWRHAHNLHHASSGDLERRGDGDVWTMTVEEYKSASKGKRLAYRLFRNPLIMFGLGPLFMFLISMRFPTKDSKKSGRRSVHLTNGILLLYVLGLSYLLGFGTFLKVQMPILFFAGMFGIWLFYVQHQFEDTYWSESEDWNLAQSALSGSSYYKLPKILQWFTGNIGLHHIHHLRPGIPNYNLPVCHEDIAVFENVPTLTIRKSLKSLRLNLWDDEKQKLVSFRSLKLGHTPVFS